MKKKKAFFAIIAALICFSIAVNVIGLQTPEDSMMNAYNAAGPSYDEKAASFDYSGNPLLDYYFPRFISDGPKSSLVNDIIFGQRLDIRDNSPNYEFRKMIVLDGIGIVGLDARFLPLFLAIAAVFLVWHREIRNILGKRAAIALVVLIIIAAFALTLEQRQVSFDRNWYPTEDNITWQTQNGTMTYYSSGPQDAYLVFSISTFEKPRILDFYANHEFLASAEINSSDDAIAFHVGLLKGENVFLFHSPDGCAFDEQTGRCISLGIRRIFLVKDKTGIEPLL